MLDSNLLDLAESFYNLTRLIMWNCYIYCVYGGIRGVIFTKVGNEHSDPYLNPGWEYLHFISR